MQKVRSKSLKPGDLWLHGRYRHPWIFLKGNEFECPLSQIKMWELHWFGRKNTEKLELVIDNWTPESTFSIISRKGDVAI